MTEGAPPSLDYHHRDNHRATVCRVVELRALLSHRETLTAVMTNATTSSMG
jgi:hypothetical protein